MYQKVNLESKRNQVHRIIKDNERYIVKEFSNVEDFKREIEIIKVLKYNDCNVPNILDIQDNMLLLEDLGDNTLLNWYEEKEKANSLDYVDILTKLIKWMDVFYRTTANQYSVSHILNDVNFRNFIIKDNEIYGIDFEQSVHGRVETDAGKLIAFALTYDPVMTKWKIGFSNLLLDTLSEGLGIEQEQIVQECNKELILIKKRRGIDEIFRLY